MFTSWIFDKWINIEYCWHCIFALIANSLVYSSDIYLSANDNLIICTILQIKSKLPIDKINRVGWNIDVFSMLSLIFIEKFWTLVLKFTYSELKFCIYSQFIPSVGDLGMHTY